jgi:hypothetical protein
MRASSINKAPADWLKEIGEPPSKIQEVLASFVAGVTLKVWVYRPDHLFLRFHGSDARKRIYEPNYWVDASVLAALIHRIAGIRWRVSHKGLILFTDWVSRPFHSPDHTEPHPPCTTIRLSRSGFQPSDARKSLLRSMVAVSPRMAV